MWSMTLLAVAAISSLSAVSAPKDDPRLQMSVVSVPYGAYTGAANPALGHLESVGLICAWTAVDAKGNTSIVASKQDDSAKFKDWFPPVVVATNVDRDAASALFDGPDNTLWLFYHADGAIRIAKTKDGDTWSESGSIANSANLAPASAPIVLGDGAWVLPVFDTQSDTARILVSKDNGSTWSPSSAVAEGSNPVAAFAIAQRERGDVVAFVQTARDDNKFVQVSTTDEGAGWTEVTPVEIPATADRHALLWLQSGNMLLAHRPPFADTNDAVVLSLSIDGGSQWKVQRTILPGPGLCGNPALYQQGGLIHLAHTLPNGGVRVVSFNEAWVWEHYLVREPFNTANVVPPLLNPDDMRTEHKRQETLPIAVAPFKEHVRGFVDVPEGVAFTALEMNADDRLVGVTGDKTRYTYDGTGVWQNMGTSDTAASGKGDTLQAAYQAGAIVIHDETADGKARATSAGLYIDGQLHPSYGIDGPLATNVTAVAYDAKGVLWIGTPLGLTKLLPDGTWEQIGGKQGLPYNDITSIAIDGNDRLWIGTAIGAIHYRPYEEGRQWFYRQGEAYLPNDHVIDVAVTRDGSTAFFLTEAGVSRIDEVDRTLHQKAEMIEETINKRHRRLGLVAGCQLDDAWNPTTHTIGDNDNDGLWTAYHVAAMAMAYAVTGDPEAKASAKESMDAVIMLQNASGVPGLVARSVVPIDEKKDAQWRPTPDGKMLWKSDTSSDEIDGHYLALYTYWQHIAQFDAEERARIIKQTRDLTDYLLDNNYLLIDWTGKGTRWGFWQPAMLNDDPLHYLENGLNALQILSFLKVSYYITGDLRYKEHYDKLITQHHYLSNVLLTKKIFPDENNHSDNQLGYVAWYPILQLEWDPQLRLTLQKGVRRHYQTLMHDDSSFFYFVTATIDPHYVNIEGGIDNLRLLSADRRQWAHTNSHRTDVIFDPRVDRFGKGQLLKVLPIDERQMDKWNSNPYVPDYAGDGKNEDDGSAYLLPYWMGRYHGFFTETN